MLTHIRNPLEKDVIKKKKKWMSTSQLKRDTRMLNQHPEKLSLEGFMGGQANFHLNLKEKTPKASRTSSWEKGHNRLRKKVFSSKLPNVKLSMLCICPQFPSTEMYDRKSKVEKCLESVTILLGSLFSLRKPTKLPIYWRWYCED